MRSKALIVMGMSLFFILVTAVCVLVGFEIFELEINVGKNDSSSDLSENDSKIDAYVGENGNIWINGSDTGIKACEGANGENSDTLIPFINEYGNWQIGDTDTGVKASGTDGEDGRDGKNGKDGADGKDGQDGTDGKDGLTPFINSNGNWQIGDFDTGINAEGKDGSNGTDGKNGADGKDGTDGKDGEHGLTPFINSKGNWQIGNTDTGIKATGANGSDGINGTDGDDGLTPFINEYGNWQIGETDTGIKAAGTDGKNGSDGKNGTDGKDGNGISEMKILNGYLYVKYTDKPDEWVNLGKIESEEQYSLKYYPLPDGTYGVSAGDLLYSDEITIPEEHNGAKVTKILPNAFAGAINLTSITLPKSVNEICDNAFLGCKNLTSVIIPENVLVAGSNVFKNCLSLRIYFECEELPEGFSEDFNPDGCELVFSFSDNSKITADGLVYEENSDGDIIITNYIGKSYLVNIPSQIEGKNVCSILSGAFASKINVISISLPKTLTDIGSGAFENCCKLVEIYNYSDISLTVGSDQNGAVAKYAEIINNNSSVPSIVSQSQDGFVFARIDGSYHLISYIGSSDKVTLPNAFSDEGYYVYSYAFYKNDNINELNVSSGVKDIGEYAFSQCQSLKRIIFNIPECPSLIGKNVFAGSGKGAGNAGISFIIGSLVKCVPAYMLSADGAEAANVFYVGFEEGSVCKTIDAYAFYGVSALAELEIAESVTVIGNMAFYGCESLSSVKIGGLWEMVSLYDFSSMTETEKANLLKNATKKLSRKN